MGRYEYRIETVVVSLGQRQLLKKLAVSLGKPYDPSVDVNACLHELRAEARRAGGDAPLPGPPATPEIDMLLGKFGAEQEVAVADKVDELLADLDAWRSTAERCASRLEQWGETNALLKQAENLPAHRQHADTLDAIRDQRSLLEDPDPVAPVAAALRAELRSALQEAHARAAQAREEAVAIVAAVPHWSELSSEEQENFLSQAGLDPLPDLDVMNDTLLASELERDGVAARIQAAPAFAGKGQGAVQALLARFAPQAQVVKAPPAMIASSEDADAYLEKLRDIITAHLTAGHAVNMV